MISSWHRRDTSPRGAAGSLVFGLFLLLLLPAAARANCVISDLPDCTCYASYPSWPLTAIAGDVVGTARRTHFNSALSVRSSCWSHRGQPYWQVQLQVGTPDAAHTLAHMVPWVTLWYPPQAWCTETVAFWHRKAGVPWTNGYGTPGGLFLWNHHPSSYVTNTDELRIWYKVEEIYRDIFGLPTRGRWIDGTELDYDDFEPGVNGPCPGAYQLLERGGFVLGIPVWAGSGTSHSQVVDSMIVYREGGAAGPVTRIDLRVIEGNIATDTIPDPNGDYFWRARVRNSKWYQRVARFTLLGDTLDSSNRKIRGWGIDLDGDGHAVYDASRIRTVVTYLAESHPDPTGPDTTDDGNVAQFVAYHAQTQGNIVVTSNSTLVQTGGTIAHPQNHWIIPPAPHPVNPVYIDVDLLAQHPYPVRGVTLDWKDGRVPAQFQVWWAGQDQQIHMQTVTPATGAPPLPPGEDLPTPIAFEPAGGHPVRYVRFCFENPVLTQPFEVTSLHYNFQVGAPEDSNLFSPDDPSMPPPVGVPSGWAEPAGSFRLIPNTPNPFSRTTTIAFEIPRGEMAELRVFDVEGRLVRRFSDPAILDGTGSVTWDGRDEHGRLVPSGTYLYELRGRDSRRWGKMTFLR